MNPIMNLLGNSDATGVMLKAFASMARGESPIDFLKNLSKTNPKLQGLNLDDLEGTAKTLCDQNNVDMNQLTDKIKEFANSNIKS